MSSPFAALASLQMGVTEGPEKPYDDTTQHKVVSTA